MKRSCGCHSHNGFRLSPEGLAQQTSLEGLTPMSEADSIDSPVSVSALPVSPDWNDALIEEQYRRFHSGS